MRRQTLFILMVLVLCSGEAIATRVFPRRLDEVLAMGTPVVRARVISSRVEIEPNQLNVYVEIDCVERLRGEVGEAGTVVHSFSTMLERPGPDGQIVRVSPIRDGSGLEQNLQSGSTYFLVLDASGGFLIRAEAQEAEPQLRALLGS